MATYKYTLKDFENDYVSFNISPDFGTPIAPGETFVITGQYKYSGIKTYGIDCVLAQSLNAYGFPSNPIQISEVNVATVAAGKVTNFTITAALPGEALNLNGSADRLFMPYLSFRIYTEANLSGNAGMLGSEACRMSVLEYRLNPVIDSVTFGDATNALSRFGNHVQTFSKPIVNIAETLDPLDPTLEITKRTLTIDRNTYALESASDTLAPQAYAGELPWKLTVTDSKGMQSSAEGTLYVLAYHAPRMTKFSVERYQEYLTDEGETKYALADDGEHVWITIAAEVAGVVGLNAWTMDLTWDDGSGSQSTRLNSGDDGQTITYNEDRALFTAKVDITSNFTFVLMLSDWFTAETDSGIVLASYVEKAESFWNVGPYGVAAGMYSTGTADHKKFEIADDHELIWYGHNIGEPDFSTSEAVTGRKWIDGKPIYRCVIEVGAKTASAMYVDVTSLGIETYVDLRGMFYASAGYASGYVYPAPYAAMSESYMLGLEAASRTSIRINSSSRTWKSGYLIVEYTKTTDT